MAIYYVELGTSVVDGSSYTANDTIIIRAGARGNLLFKNFNGNGQYITITNEDSASRVVITHDGSAGWGALSLENCSYVDLRGNNSESREYGIKVVAPSNPGVRVYNEGDHIKLGYLEVTGNGIHTPGNPDLTAASIFDTFEIHHNYIHDTKYAGMYLGHNLPSVNDDPYISNFSIHDNLLEDMGAYGITLKGVHSSSGVCQIYNNTVRPSNRSSGGGNSTGLIYASEGSAWHGIGVQYFYGSTYANIYDNWIEKTRGPGLKIGDQKHQVYNNIICGCGNNDTDGWSSGIITYQSVYGGHLYDNIIIQPKKYGIYAWGTTQTGGVTMSRNLIGDAGLGEWYAMAPGDLIESTGADANIYHANVADFGFNKWSDDGDYSNDSFTFNGDLCDGVVCDDICIGNDLYSQKCDPVTGNCVTDQLLESDSLDCKLPTDEDTIMKYITLGGLGLVAYIMLKMGKK